MEVENNYIKEVLQSFKKHHRYSPTQLGKIERIEIYIIKLEQENKKMRKENKK